MYEEHGDTPAAGVIVGIGYVSERQCVVKVKVYPVEYAPVSLLLFHGLEVANRFTFS